MCEYDEGTSAADAHSLTSYGNHGPRVAQIGDLLGFARFLAGEEELRDP